MACGFVEIKVAPSANRLPCIWPLDETGNYETFTALPTPEEAMSGAAVAINGGDTVVGYTEDRKGVRRACRWNRSATGWIWEDLAVEGVAVSINWLGIVVGGSPGKPFLWQCEERFDLNTLLKRGNGQRLEQVFAIGELGDLIGNLGGKRLVLQPITTLAF